MLRPYRDNSDLESPLVLAPLPGGAQWEGKIAYLDRDGVLNKGSENYINSPDEVIVLDGAADSIASLRASGFRVCVVTNQSPVGRGHWSHEDLFAIHLTLRNILASENKDAVIDLLLYSPYVPWEESWARKPNPGMLEAGRQLIDAAHSRPGEWVDIKFGKDWENRPDESGSIMVGDRDSDMQAARSHGVKGIQCSPENGLSGVIAEIMGR